MDVSTELKEMVSSLFKMVKDSCWNKISKNTTFIITSNEDETFVSWEKRILKKKKLLKEKKEINFKELVEFFSKKLPEIYLIEMYLFKSLKSKTIIEIRLKYKSQLDKEYIESLSLKVPLRHCKIHMPPYLKKKNKKFDINWEFGTLENKIQMFLWKKNLN